MSQIKIFNEIFMEIKFGFERKNFSEVTLYKHELEITLQIKENIQNIQRY